MIYDCFTYFNEVELLELRLHTLAEVVDYFVIVEADRTFSGLPRSFLFPQHRQHVAQYADKIIYIQVTDMPQSDNPWIREYFQRDCILRGLGACRCDDIILISDADEIPRPEALTQLVGSSQGQTILARYPVAFAQNHFLYFLNCMERRFWQGTVAVRYENLQRPQTIRDNRDRAPRIRDGGWHFSFLGGVARISEKIKSYSHQEYSSRRLTDDYIRQAIETGVSDLFNDKSFRLHFVSIDDSYPAYTNRLVETYPALLFDAAEKIPTASAGPSKPGSLFYNFPRWHWFLLKQRLKLWLATSSAPGGKI